MRNSIEALEARVLLSAHGASADDDTPGPHGVGLAHAAAPAQQNAAEHSQANSSSDNSDNQGNDDVVTTPLSSGSSDQDSSDQQPDAAPQIVRPSTPIPTDSTSESVSPAGDSVTIDIVYVDQIPAPGAGGLTSTQQHPSTSDQSSSSGDGSDSSGWQTPAIVATWGSDPSTLAWWSVPAIPAGRHVPGTPGQGGISRDGNHGDDPSDNGESEQGGGRVVFQLLHADPPPVQSPPSATTAIAHAPDAIATVKQPAPSAAPATSTDASAVSNTAVPVTPLALTPSRPSASSPFAGANTSPAMSVTVIVDSHSSAAPVSTKASGSEISAPAPNPFGQVAAIVPPFLSIVRTITANPPSVQAVVEHIKTAGAVAANVEAMTTEAIAGSAPAQIAYNFVQFDAGSFRDTISRFANELATLTTTTHSKASATRAWIITGTVLGLDAIFLGYCHSRARKQKKGKLALARISGDLKSGERIDD